MLEDEMEHRKQLAVVWMVVVVVVEKTNAQCQVPVPDAPPTFLMCLRKRSFRIKKGCARGYSSDARTHTREDTKERGRG